MNYEFEQAIFFGSPGCFEGMWRAQAQLHKGFDILSGMQQPLPCTTPVKIWRAHERERRKDERELRRIVKDLGAALGYQVRIVGPLDDDRDDDLEELLDDIEPRRRRRKHKRRRR